eukprot:3261610-Amphidinium_carterae.1
MLMRQPNQMMHLHIFDGCDLLALLEVVIIGTDHSDTSVLAPMQEQQLTTFEPCKRRMKSQALGDSPAHRGARIG